MITILLVANKVQYKLNCNYSIIFKDSPRLLALFKKLVEITVLLDFMDFTCTTVAQSRGQEV